MTKQDNRPSSQPPKLSDLQVEDNKQLVADVLALTKAMRADSKIWSIYERVTDQLEITDEEQSLIGQFTLDYFESLGKKKPLDASLSGPILRQLAAGKYKDLDGQDVQSFLIDRCKFN